MASLSVEPPIHPPPGAQPVGGAPKGEGVCAVVVFDYEAAEDNEMNLTEGEMIEQIEEIDEGENITPLSCRGRSMTFGRVSYRMVVWYGCQSIQERLVPRSVSSVNTNGHFSDVVFLKPIMLKWSSKPRLLPNRRKKLHLLPRPLPLPL